MSNKTQEVEITLTPEQVEAIRLAARTPGITYAAIATQYDIDKGHVAFIAAREDK